MLARILLGAGVLGLVACGGGSYDTKREAGIAVFGALCERAAECDQIQNSQVQDCVSELVGELCDGRDCNAAPVADNEAIDDCIDRIEVLSCTAENLPAECNSII